MADLLLFTLLTSLICDISISRCPYTNHETDCLSAPTTLSDLCGIPDQVFAWYTGDTYDALSGSWFDQGGYCRNVDSSFITGTITRYSDLNGETYVTGTTSTRLYFPYEVLPINYTFFHVTRYFDGTEDIIFQSFDYTWYSGFHGGTTGIAAHETTITDTSDRFGRQWFISTDLRNQYRANGVDRTRSIQTDYTDITHQYRLAINDGYAGTDDSSDWAVAEIIVFERELLVDEYQCIEQYLGDKYNIDIYTSECDLKATEVIDLEEKCELLPTYAMYDGSSFNPDTNVWSDISGSCRNVDDNMITGDITIHKANDILNNQTYVTGTVSTKIDFPVDVLPQTYTLFHVARYNDGSEARIFQAYTYSFISGFYSGKSGIAHHSNWITQSSADLHGTDWVLSTDQRNMYRSGGVSRQNTIQSASNSKHRYRMAINSGATSEYSDFAVAEVIVFDYELNPKQYKCVEQYLSDKYDISIEQTPCLNDNDTFIDNDPAWDGYLKCNLSDYELVAWYDGSTFNADEQVWYDKSGQCYNVDSAYIGGTITTGDNLNGETYITGTTSTTISFPYNILPLQYTFFHVARYFGTEKRIFQSFEYAWLSGFYNGRSGVAHHGNWITQTSADLHGSEWVLSSDQRSLYRSQGTSRMTNDQTASYSSNKYRLAVNTGVYPAEDSAFGIAEMIVIDGELNPKQVKCIEKQLSDKYGLLNSATDCKPKNDSLTTRCRLSGDVFAWYQGDHFDDTEQIWFDDSGYCRNIDTPFMVGTITTQSDLNAHQYLTGTTATRVYFPYDVLPQTYTLFHVARYNDGTEDIIFQAFDYNWISGFYQGAAGVAIHENWITSSSVDSHTTNWVISSDQRSVYRSNGVPRMTDSQTSSTYANHRYRLAINNGYHGTDDSSDWAVAEVIVFDYEMDPSEYQCVEQYLGTKYDIAMVSESACTEDLAPSDHDILAECGVEDDVFAWYDGATFDLDENAWFDKSGHCRNVENEFISGTVNINTDLNDNAYLTGTTSTSIAFPHDVLPLDYTFFHVAKWNDGGARNRIFQSFDYNFLSGFQESGLSGVAYHENWITPALDKHGADWVISTDSRSLYRSNGVSRSSDNQSPSYHANQYKLGLNTGKYTGATYTSDWSVAEVVVFDKTLNAPEYKCMENYLALKYDLCLTTHAPTMPPTAHTRAPTPNPTESRCLSEEDVTLRDYECQPADVTRELYDACELIEDDIYAWYSGASYNADLNEWFDQSGNCRNVKDAYISGTITTYDDLNGETYLTGSTATTIDFPYDVLPPQYTLFHMARYFDGSEGRIFQSYDVNWLSGFYNGYSGVALHENWITPSNIDLHGREWVISADQRSMYRSDGKMRSTATQTTSYANNRYRLAINNGAYATQDSDWAVADIIVMDYEANTKTIKCVENYLSTKYAEPIYESECKDTEAPVTHLADQCGFDRERLFAWFDGDSYDENTNIWYDKSGYCRNVDSDYISGALDVQNDLNGENYVNGSTSTTVQFPFEILPKEYTFMHVARYQPDGTHTRIFQAANYNFLSGFNAGGVSGVAYHENWITAAVNNHGAGWVLSTDQRSLYRSNGVSRLTDSQSPSYADHRYELMINKASSYTSDFAVAEMLVFDEELLPSQYKCMESYLSHKYDITVTTPSECLDNTETHTFQTQCNTLDGDLQPFAWYDGSSYSFSDTVWMDKSGHCRNIESEHISGDIFINNDLNGNRSYLTGTASSRMEFPYDVLPQTYTFIHVAKWISTATGRIFNAFDYNWWSGFNEYYVTDVSAYHENWITPTPGSTAADYLKDWIISTDQRNVYRANGVFKMNTDQNSGFKSNRYRLGLNTGYQPATDARYGAWAVAEVLVFDGELEPVQYKCIEEYLSHKYNISITSTDCKPQNDTITDECGLRQKPVAWYNGDSFDPAQNTWFDNSMYCRNIDSEFITNANTISLIDDDPYDDYGMANGQSYITGSTTTRIDFPYELLPLNYNLFHVARYFEGTQDIIFQAYDYAWLSGFYAGSAGVAAHEGWITSSSRSTYGRQWVISNDQRSLFRSNGIGRTSDTQSVSYAANHYRLAINRGYYGTDDPSHFGIAEIIIFDYELTSKEYKCVESFLCDKYDKVCHQSAVIAFQQIDIDNANAILLTDQCPDVNTSSIVAWYNGDSYDSAENIWFDQSGYGRNVDSEYISGTIEVGNELNNYKYVTGSTSTTIDFPFDLLPQSYTFMHVAKYNGGTKDRIFQSYDFSWTSGFTNGLSGTAYHQNWITPSNVDYHGTAWVLSTDQRNLYRSNGVDRMVNDQTASYNDNRYILTVNNGLNGGEDSDFAIAEMVIFDEELSIAHYRCVEEYLAMKYNLCLPVPSTDIIPNINISSSSTTTSAEPLDTTTTSVLPSDIDTTITTEATATAIPVPSNQSYCEDNGFISHLEWNDLNRTSPEYELNINIDTADLSMTVELVTEYIGYAYTENDDMVGSAYVFDFAQFHSVEDRLDEAGSCSNRLVSAYEGKTWSEYWQYSDAPLQLGTAEYLAYGPLPSYWDASALDNCTTIRYSGQFTWGDLRNCASFDGDKLMQIRTDDAWINMTGRFYVSVISPYSMLMDVGIYYLTDLVRSYPFQISIRKSIHVLNHVGIDVFLVTIFQSRRTFNKTHSNEGGGYVIILSSQTEGYMQLTEPNLLSNPPPYDTWEIATLNDADCHINANGICIQFWMLYIENLGCPVSFDGEFDIAWTAVCNTNEDDHDDDDEDTQCNAHLNSYGNQTVLSIHMAYSDPFECDVVHKANRLNHEGMTRFYTDSSFAQETTDDPPIYQSGIDDIYVEIEVMDLDPSLNANLLNVWICAAASNNDSEIIRIMHGDEVNSGCFDSELIDENTFTAIIVNKRPLLFSPLIYNTSSLHNVIRFSFAAPNWLGVTLVYIHSEVALSDAYARRRRLLLNSDSSYDPYIHMMTAAAIAPPYHQDTTSYHDDNLSQTLDTTTASRDGDLMAETTAYDVELEEKKEPAHAMMWFIVLSIVGCVCIASAIVFAIIRQRLRVQKRRKHVYSNVDITDNIPPAPVVGVVPQTTKDYVTITGAHEEDSIL